MNIPDNEIQKIVEWMKAELYRIDKEVPLGPGLDGPTMIAEKAVFAEYNRRLDALYLKYSDTPAPIFTETLQHA